MERWQRQFIRYLFPYSASRMQIEPAFVVKQPHIPQFLYKYREFEPTHLDALRRGVLYMSSPDRFNDPFDTTVFFDPSRFVVEDVPAKEFIKRAKEINCGERSGEPWLPKAIKKPIRQDDWIRKEIAEVLKDEQTDLRDALMDTVKEWLDKQSEEMRQRMREAFRSGFSVLSLTADPTLPIRLSPTPTICSVSPWTAGKGRRRRIEEAIRLILDCSENRTGV